MGGDEGEDEREEGGVIELRRGRINFGDRLMTTMPCPVSLQSKWTIAAEPPLWRAFEVASLRSCSGD